MTSTKRAPKRLSKQHRAMLLDILRDINAEELRSLDNLPEEFPQWLLDWPIWSAGENMPGYMPDSPYSLSLTERAARGYCRELERAGAEAEGYVTDMMQTSLREVLSGVTTT